MTGGSLPPLSLEDFRSIEKIDAHVHLNAQDDSLVRAAEGLGFRLLTINTDYPDFPPLVEQEAAAIGLSSAHPSRVAFATTFSMEGWGEPGWAEAAIASVEEAVGRGACALKLWKNLGMSFLDRLGRPVTVDDPGLLPVLEGAMAMGLPVIGHQGEPRDCWLPLEDMSPEYREYFGAHPEYHMLLHPEFPSYEGQLAARDALLVRMPGLAFVAAHLASLEWSVDAIAAFLDAFPRAYVDTAARLGDLRRQAAADREKVRRFLEGYSGRVIYGTDLVQGPGDEPGELVREAEATWLEDWRFLALDLGLSRPALERIYRSNALAVFSGGWGQPRRTAASRARRARERPGPGGGSPS